jgi:DNA helicase-2/ATP-dependent DNA helicase PcrA
VLVDEFQDTDKNQLTILKYIINPDFNNVFVVGDEDQTIYTWRGAYPQIFHDFYKTFDNAQTFVLNLNYRSCKKILHLSNELIKKNTRRVDKQLITDNDDGADIVFYQGQNEGEFVVNKIVELMKEQHFNYSDFAILYRSNYLSRNVETSLINKSISYYMYGGIKFYQRKEIKDMIAYLRLFEDHTDELALKRVINVPRRNIGLTTIQKIVDYATRYHLRFSQALELSADLSYNLP